jgi:hypothetical protein
MITLAANVLVLVMIQDDRSGTTSGWRGRFVRMSEYSEI